MPTGRPWFYPARGYPESLRRVPRPGDREAGAHARDRVEHRQNRGGGREPPGLPVLFENSRSAHVNPSYVQVSRLLAPVISASRNAVRSCPVQAASSRVCLSGDRMRVRRFSNTEAPASRTVGMAAEHHAARKTGAGSLRLRPQPLLQRVDVDVRGTRYGKSLSARQDGAYALR